MTIQIEHFKIDIFAKVIDGGRVYVTYQTFAEAAKMPDAAEKIFSLQASKKSTRASKLRGKIVKVLATGTHEDSGDLIYVIEDESEEKFLINSAGVEMLEGNVDIEPKEDEVKRKGTRLTKEEKRAVDSLLASVGRDKFEAINYHSEIYSGIRRNWGDYNPLKNVPPAILSEYLLVGEFRFVKGDIGKTKLGTYVKRPEDIQMYYEKGMLEGYYPSENFISLE